MGVGPSLSSGHTKAGTTRDWEYSSPPTTLTVELFGTNHGPGSALPPSIKVVSSTVAAGKRTVVLSRAPKGVRIISSLPRHQGEDDTPRHVRNQTC